MSNIDRAEQLPLRDDLLTMKNCLHAQFEQIALRTPNQVAIVLDGQSLTYGELNRQANVVANQLIAAGVGNKDMVGLALPRDLSLLPGLIGILKTGAAYVPLDPNYPQARLDDIVEDCKAAAIVTTSQIASDIRLDGTLIKLDELQKSAAWHDESESQSPDVAISPDDIAYVIYTSGSTGKPKGVLVSHTNVIRLYTETHGWFQFNRHDTWTLFHSFAFDFSVWEIWGALLYGGKLVIIPFEMSRSPVEFYKVLASEHVTILNQTPSAFRQLILADERLHQVYELSLRLVVFGGEALEFSSLRGWVQRHGAEQPRLVNMYGITETTVHVTYRPLALSDIMAEQSSLIGAPIPDLELYVLDENREKVANGTTGEIYVGGAGVAQGYLHRPELTAQRFIPNPFSKSDSKLYRTGDLGRFRDDGELEYLGRCDRQVQLRGFRVELGEIESNLHSHDSVAQAIVIVRNTGSGEQQLVAYLVPSPDDSIHADELRASLSQTLPSYMVPQYFVAIDDIPLTANGKLDAGALPEPILDHANQPYVSPKSSTEIAIAKIWRQLLGQDRVTTDRTFFELGGQSLMLAEMELRLNEALPAQFAIVDLFQHPTISKLARHLDNKQKSDRRKKKRAVAKSAPIDSTGLLPPIAIVGMATCVPDATNVHEFWDNLKNGVESIRRLSRDELLAAGVSHDVIDHPNFVPVTASLDHVDYFDAEFFGISPHEAKITDPQHRLFLECAWTALEDAGYDPAQTDGNIGVYAGARPNDYRDLIYRVQGPPDPSTAFQTLISNEKDFLATRVSFRLNLNGPSMTVQTGCSTSLVAVQLACQALQLQQCSMALAGAVSVNLVYRNGYISQEGMILSPDGHVRTFDDEAKGTVFGEGVGVVVLKRLSDAIADGDKIHGVIKAVAINNDGNAKMSYSAPSIDGQTEVVQMAHEQSGITADKIGYVEAHGTGTFVGDPVEIEALTQAFRATTDKKQFCNVGSVKTNLGHQDVAAGIIGLIKATCAVRDGIIPQSLNYQTPNRNADFANSPFCVATETISWDDAEANNEPRRAGVSSFGIGGTNAHAIVEQAPRLEPSLAANTQPSADPTESTGLPHLLVLSARDDTALDIASRKLAQHLDEHADVPLTDIEHTLKNGRRGFGCRRAVFGKSRSELIQALSNPDTANGVHFDCTSLLRSVGEADVGFLFPGQGAQYAGMTRDLYDSVASFRADMDYFNQVAKQWLSVDLRESIFNRESDDERAQQRLSETWLAQPAITATELGLARLWMRNGITPSCVLGHSVGEIAAACVAGIFSIETAIELSIQRGRLLQDLPRGKMLAVTLSAAELQERLPTELSLAVVNSPQHCVVSGPSETVDAFAAALQNEEIACRVLHTSHAFHSPMMEPAMDEFRNIVANHKRMPPEIPIVSTVTGTWANPNDMTDPEYWARNIRHTVQFSQAAGALIERDTSIFLEVGPGQTLSSLIRLQLEMTGQTIRSTRHPNESTGDVEQWMKSYAKIWACGAKVQWPEVGSESTSRKPQRVSLPTYPFQRKRYWIEEAPPGSVASNPQSPGKNPKHAKLVNAEIAAALPQEHEPFDSWFYAQTWEPKPATPTDQEAKNWLLLVGPDENSADLVQRLKEAGHNCVTVQVGSSYSKREHDRFTIAPDQPKDFDRLLQDLSDNGHFPSHIVHLWQWQTADAIDSLQSDWLQGLHDQQTLGLYSLQFLAQALGRFRLNQPVQLSIIASRLASAFSEESQIDQPPSIVPGRATMIGAAKVIPIEYPQISCKLIDVPWEDTQQACDELLSSTDDNWVAYRNGQRCIPSVVRHPLDESYANTKRLKHGGTYLITGGLGGIGFTIAKHLLQSVQANVALLGRSELPPPDEWENWIADHGKDHATSQKLERLRELESLPGRVAHFSANVSDASQMRTTVARITNELGLINGIVHAAGVADTAGAIQQRDRNATDSMLQSKVHGTLTLQAVLADHPVDFWVLFSSISNVLYHNRYGQISYVAGNSFLEAFAAKMQQSGTHAVAIASDEWQAIGMAAEVARDFADSFGSTKQLFDPLDSFTPDQGAQMFQRILSSEAPAILISTRDLKQRMELDIHAKSPFLEAAREALDSSTSLSNIPATTTSSGLAGHLRIAEMWEQLLAIPKVAPNDNYFELGGDSLTAVRFLAELGKQCGQQLPFATMVEFPTPTKLATHLGLDASESKDAHATVTSSQPSAHRSTLAEIEANDDLPRLFCMHAADGYALIFRDLAKRLNNEYSVYGLQSPALFGEETESIEELAARYVHDIRQKQPHGPYLLTGYCMGGTLALEVAQQLKSDGEQVILICIETYNWCTSQAANKRFGVKLVYYLQKVDFHFRNFWKLGFSDKIAFLREKIRVFSRRKDIWISRITKRSHDVDNGAQRSASEIWERHDEIAELYQPQTYDGKIIHFRAQQDYIAYKDKAFPATQKPEVHRLPVYPAGMMVHPFVDQLAVEFAECLRDERAQLNSRS